MNTSMEMVALELLEVVPPIMSTIKMKWKKGTIAGVDNLQFKILGYLQKMSQASLQEVTQDRGLPTPTIMSAIDDLVSRQLVSQQSSGADPDKMAFYISETGQKTLLGIYEKSRTDLEEQLSPLTADERTLVLQALKIMGPLFSQNKEPDEVIENQKELWKNHG